MMFWLSRSLWLSMLPYVTLLPLLDHRNDHGRNDPRSHSSSASNEEVTAVPAGGLVLVGLTLDSKRELSRTLHVKHKETSL